VAALGALEDHLGGKADPAPARRALQPGLPALIGLGRTLLAVTIPVAVPIVVLVAPMAVLAI
jgi:fumarate reductase subunit D